MLTAIEVRNAKPKDKPYKLTDGKGLHLHVATSGKKTWRYRFALAGTESVFVLGEYPEIPLDIAREKLAAAKKQVKAGINPAAERRQEKQATIQEQAERKALAKNSFEAIALEWHRQKKGTWSETHAEQTLLFLHREVFPAIGTLQVDKITPPMVLQVLREIETRDALEIARKTLQRMNSVFRYAVQTGRCTFNPAADMKGVRKTRKVKNHAMIDPAELPALLQALTAADVHTTTRLALQFTILTAARTGEVRFATWDEIDLEKRLWSIPAARMKMQRPHVVPLSTGALAILNRAKILYGDSGYIFPGAKGPAKPFSENTMLYCLYRIGYKDKATPHGFRALFSTIANEAGFNPDAIERQLAHQEKSAVRGAYNRGVYLKERAELMQWWSDHLHHLEHGADIVPIGRKAAGGK